MPKIKPDVIAIRETADGVAIDLRITADLAPLAGHFPGVPIVPGVALLDWVVRFATDHLAFSDRGASRLQIKFRRVLQPGCDVTLTLNAGAGGRVRFEYRHLDIVYCSGSITSGVP